jgi:hypothetical protein
MRSSDRPIRDLPAATSGPTDRRAADFGGYPTGWEDRESADARMQAACSRGLMRAAKPAIAPSFAAAPNHPLPPATADPSPSQPQETAAAIKGHRSSTIVIESPGPSHAEASNPSAGSTQPGHHLAPPSLAVATARAGESFCRCHEGRSPKHADAPPTASRETPVSVAGSASKGSPPVR